MINKDIRDIIYDMGCENSVVFDNPDFDQAIIGISEDGNVVYDYDLMVEELIKNEDMTYEEAVDFISYNTIRVIPYINNPKPIVMYRLIDYNS